MHHNSTASILNPLECKGMPNYSAMSNNMKL